MDAATVRALAPARDALRAGRVADALQRLDEAGDVGPEGLLLRALLLRLLDRDGVAPLIEAATADGDPVRLVRAARIVGWAAGFAHTTRVPRRPRPEELAHASRLLEAALTASPGALDALEARFELEALLGREGEAVATLEAVVARVPDDLRRRLRLVRLLLGHRDPEAALPHAEATVALAPDHADALALRRDVRVTLGRADAGEAVDAALVADPARWSDAAAAWLRIGRPDRADGVVDAAPEGPARDAWRARLALWRGDAALARELAGALAGPLPAIARAGAAVLEGRPADARAELATHVAPGAKAEGFLDELLAWSSDASRRLGDAPVARREADRARTAATDYSLAAHLVQVLAILEAQRVVEGPPDPWIWRPLAEKLDDLVPDAAGATTVAAARTLARRALDRLAGNRSSTPTKVEQGTLVAVRHPPHPRHEARAVQHLLRTRTVDEVDAAFEALHARLPGSPNTFTYHGEVLVWVGRYAASVPRFEAALRLDRATVWAWIGLGAAQLFLGDDAAALATWREGEAAVRYRGPTLDVYEAELWARRGDPERAVPLLDKALSGKPIRYAAWALRALVEHDRTGATRPAALVVEQLRARAPGLWLDAVEAGGSEAPVDVLRATLSLMHGNRSSTLACWPAADGRFRFARWGALLRPDVVFARA